LYNGRLGKRGVGVLIIPGCNNQSHFLYFVLERYTGKHFVSHRDSIHELRWNHTIHSNYNVQPISRLFAFHPHTQPKMAGLTKRKGFATTTKNSTTRARRT
jgi:hypothetical protein